MIIVWAPKKIQMVLCDEEIQHLRQILDSNLIMWGVLPCRRPALWPFGVKAKQNNTIPLCTALYIHVQIGTSSPGFGVFEALGKIRGKSVTTSSQSIVVGVDTRVDRGSGAKSGIG